VICAIGFPIALPVYLVLALIIVAFEKSSRYSESAGVSVVAVLVLVYALILPGLGAWRLVDRWAAGQEVDQVSALEATYVWSRKGTARALGVTAVVGGVLAVIVGVIAGATGSRLGQYGILGAVFGPACHLIGVHSILEAAARPVRVALAGGTGIGDSLARSRPTFATWTNLSMLGVAFAFAVSGAMLTAVFDRASQIPRFGS
jgi:adenylate cyclase